jgi:hypothetical protein
LLELKLKTNKLTLHKAKKERAMINLKQIIVSLSLPMCEAKSFNDIRN